MFLSTVTGVTTRTVKESASGLGLLLLELVRFEVLVLKDVEEKASVYALVRFLRQELELLVCYHQQSSEFSGRLKIPFPFRPVQDSISSRFGPGSVWLVLFAQRFFLFKFFVLELFVL
jgi:hypothetical protein